MSLEDLGGASVHERKRKINLRCLIVGHPEIFQYFDMSGSHMFQFNCI